MSAELNKVSEALFEKIRSRFEEVSIGDENAASTQDPEQARFFNFDYVDRAGNNFGNITISLVDENSLKVYFSKSLSSELEEDQKAEWFDFLRDLRMFAKRNLLSFDTRDITRSNLRVKDIKQVSRSDASFNSSEVGMQESKNMNKHLNDFESWVNTVTEGTWAVPVEDLDIQKLQELMSDTLEAGIDGQNATSALYDIIGDDALFDRIYDASRGSPEMDVRPIIYSWLEDNMPSVFEKVQGNMEAGGIEQNAPAPEEPIDPATPPAPEEQQQPQESAEDPLRTVRRLAGLRNNE